MSLLEDLKRYYQTEKSPAQGGDLDYDFVDGEWVQRDDGYIVTEQISYEVIDDSPRWGDVIQVVYRRGSEFVAVEDVAPASEYQSWGDYGDPEIYEVRPVEVLVTKYERV